MRIGTRRAPVARRLCQPSREIPLCSVKESVLCEREREEGEREREDEKLKGGVRKKNVRIYRKNYFTPNERSKKMCVPARVRKSEERGKGDNGARGFTITP